MHKFLKSLLFTFAVSSLFVSCSKDAVEKKNFIAYDGVEYPLTKAYFEGYGQDQPNEGYLIDAYFFSEGINVIGANPNQIDSLSGSGTVVYLELFSNIKDLLEKGDYIYDANQTYLSNTFDFGLVGLNFDINNGNGSVFDISGGKVSVKTSGTSYEITFDLTESGGKKITGSYSGEVKYQAYSAINNKGVAKKSNHVSDEIR
jgi:hypothetical protein